METTKLHYYIDEDGVERVFELVIASTLKIKYVRSRK